MNAEEDTTEIQGIYVGSKCRYQGEEDQKVKILLEEKSQRALIEVNYNVSKSYANSLEDYIKHLPSN